MKPSRSKVIIVGAAGSGKDYLKFACSNHGYRISVDTTTRPQREGETDGVDYCFVTKDEFMRKTIDDEFLIWKEFNGWLYGTTMDSWNKDNVFIMSPKALSELPQEQRKQSIVIYLDIAEETRMERQTSREGYPIGELERRIESDRKQFEGFCDFDLRIRNSTFTPDVLVVALKILMSTI